MRITKSADKIKTTAFELSSDKNVITITFKTTRLEQNIAKEIEGELERIFLELSPLEGSIIILSFKNINIVDASGLKSILRFWRFVALNTNVVLTFANCKEPILKYFRLCKLHHIINIYKTEEEAIKYKGVAGFA